MLYHLPNTKIINNKLRVCVGYFNFTMGEEYSLMKISQRKTF
jgi:hypothetical protein